MTVRLIRPGDRQTLLHPRFIAAGASLLIAGFVTDIAYVMTWVWQWANFSAWLITFGLILALVAGIFLLVDVLTRRAGRMDWLHFGLLAAAALLSLLNAFVHSRDAATSVAGEGIVLSAIVTVILLVTAIGGWRVTAIRTPQGEVL